MAKIISHPTLLVAEAIKTIDPGKLKEFLEVVDRLNNEGKALDSVLHMIQDRDWHPIADDLDTLAEYLNTFDPHFEECPNKSALQPAAVNDKTREAAKQIYQAFQENQKDSVETDGFTRSARLAVAFQELLGEHDPIPSIKLHLRWLFENVTTRQGHTKRKLLVPSSLFSILAVIAQRLVQAYPSDKRVTTISYWLSNPFEENSNEIISAEELPKLIKLGRSYADLLFTRFTYSTDSDQLSPNVNSWSEWEWIFDHAHDKYQMNRVVNAAFELRDLSEVLPDDSPESTQAIAKFFERVEKLQNENDGGSFWDIDIAAYKVSWLFANWMTIHTIIPIDFPSELAGYVQQDAYEPDFPDLASWHSIIKRSLKMGHVKLAQALGAYVLLEQVMSFKSVSDWPMMIAIINFLKKNSDFSIMTPAIKAAHELFVSWGKPLFSARLESFTTPSTVARKSGIQWVREMCHQASRDEVRVRLKENIGMENWEKFAESSQELLVEADYNWAHWRFVSKDDQRTDWSPIGTQFGKAIEAEMVLRYGPLCVAAGEVGANKPVMMGRVLKLFRDTDGSLTLPDGRSIKVDRRLQKRLSRFHNLRNLAAHPGEFGIEKCDEMRLELFSRQLLRDIATNLL